MMLSTVNLVSTFLFNAFAKNLKSIQEILILQYYSFDVKHKMAKIMYCLGKMYFFKWFADRKVSET